MIQATKQEKEELRTNKQKARGEFQSMLREWPGLRSGASFREAARSFHSSDPWRLLDLEELDELFQDVISSTDFRDIRHKNKKSLFDFFSSHPDSFGTGQTRWGDLPPLMAENEAWAALDNLDRLDVWMDYVEEGMHRLRDEERLAERRVGRIARGEFSAGIGEMAELVEFENIKKLKIYQNLIGTPLSSQPYDLYKEEVDRRRNRIDI
jgi:hypothetical protein